MKATDLNPSSGSGGPEEVKTELIMRILLATILALTLLPRTAWCCPMIYNSEGLLPLVDFDCNQEIRLLFGGDSITRGVGDIDINDQNGGWPLDLELLLPHAQIVNLGVPGADSRRYNRDLRKNLKKGKIITTTKASHDDLMVFMLGTNDYWNRNEYSASTVPNYIIRIQKFLQKYYIENIGPPPLMLVATLPPTKRSFQQPWINEVNKYLLARANKLNVQIRFDKLSDKIISDDQLHPDKKGYRKMANLAFRTLHGRVQNQMIAQRQDKDSDGIYDLFETLRFGTDPQQVDSDGDGVSDGDEVFVNFSDPLDPASF